MIQCLAALWLFSRVVRGNVCRALGGQKLPCFSYFVNSYNRRRIGQKPADWKSQTLSVAYKVFIKSDLTDIHQYTMNWFKIPKYICRDIGSPNGIFLGTIIEIVIIKNTTYPSNSIVWNKTCRPKCE